MKNEIVYNKSTAYFHSLQLALEGAKESIDLEMYIFIPTQSPGLEMVKIIQKKAEQGLKIRVLVDGVGSFEAMSELNLIFSGSKTQFKIYNPTFWQAVTHPESQGPFWKKLWESFQRVNSRNHKKVTIIDKKIAFLGSYNFSPEHLPPPSGEEWADVGVRLSNHSVDFLHYLFEYAWFKNSLFSRAKNLLKFHKLPFNHESPIRFNSTRRSRKFFYRDFLHRIHRARTELTLVTPYFNPTWGLVRGLTKAARNGVTVKLIIGKKTDVLFYRFLPHVFFHDLERFGVKIYFYRPSVLHAKISIIDSWVAIGSSNLNYRSFFHDLEVDATIHNIENRLELKSYAQKLENSSELFSPMNRLPWWKLMIGKFFYIFRYWL